MNQSFTLLQLPIIPFDIIYHHFSYNTLVLLSTCSKRTKEIIRNSERVLKKRHTCDINVYDKKRTIRLEPENARIVTVGVNGQCTSVRSIGWRFSMGLIDFDDKQLTNHVRYKEFKLKVDGFNWLIRSNGCDWAYESCNEEEDFLFWLNYLKNLFNCQLTEISLRLGPSVDFEKLLVKSDQLHVADKITVYSERETSFQSHFEMTHMLDHFVANSMRLSVSAPKDFTYKGVINKIRDLVILDGHWLSMNDVWIMTETCTRFHIQNFKCTNTSLNWFIKQWLESDNKSLEMLRFQKQSTDKHLNPAIVFKDIETKPTCRKWWDDRMKYIVTFGHANGVDILRKDGIRATIFLQSSNRNPQGTNFATLFLVWTEPEPKCLLNEFPSFCSHHIIR